MKGRRILEKDRIESTIDGNTQTCRTISRCTRISLEYVQQVTRQLLREGKIKRKKEKGHRIHGHSWLYYKGEIE
jgi:hypothetical protein